MSVKITHNPMLEGPHRAHHQATSADCTALALCRCHCSIWSSSI